MENDDITFLLAKELIITIIVIFIVAIVIANLIVIIKILMRFHRYTVAYLYIVSLCVSDILVGVVVCSVTLVGGLGVKVHEGWCGVAGFLELSLFSSGILSLLAITWDRYRAVLKAQTYKPVMSMALKVIAIVWTVSFLYGLRFFLQIAVEKHLHNENEQTSSESKIKNATTHNSTSSKDVHHANDDGDDDFRFNADGTACSFFVEDRNYDIIFRFVDIVVLLVLPITLMILMYSRIVRFLNKLTSQDVALIKRKKRVIKMLISCIVVFCACWIPFYLQDIVFDLIELTTGESEEEHSQGAENIIRYLCAFLVLLNGIINPIIYGYFRKTFRQDLESFAATTENINLPLM